MFVSMCVVSSCSKHGGVINIACINFAMLVRVISSLFLFLSFSFSLSHHYLFDFSFDPRQAIWVLAMFLKKHASKKSARQWLRCVKVTCLCTV